MPRFLQTFAGTLPLYYVNEGLRASMVFRDHATPPSCSAIMGTVAATVFIVGITATRWEEGT